MVLDIYMILIFQTCVWFYPNF